MGGGREGGEEGGRMLYLSPEVHYCQTPVHTQVNGDQQ